MTDKLESLSCIALLLSHEWTEQSAIRAALIEDETPYNLVRQLPNSRLLLERAEMQLDRWRSSNHSVVTFEDENYPIQLRDVHDFPLALFWEGQLWESKKVEPAVAIVGSRTADERSLDTAAWLSTQLSEDGISVVSGLARGIDQQAHTAALQHGGRTVAIIGTGIDVSYPPENASLQRSIGKNGLVVSQFLPGFKPTRYSFPMRNAVMSAFSSVTVILQAEEKSGTRHQASAALKHGRPLVITSKVATSTSWGRKLATSAHYADVQIVESPREALQAARKYAFNTHDISLSLA